MKKPLMWLAVPALAVIGVGMYLLVQHISTATFADNGQPHCATNGPLHTITIKNDVMQPDHITGKLCDRLKVVNGDDELRLIAFGPHEHHVAYDGIAEHALDAHQSFTVTLVQAGTFLIHDHIHDEAQGSFTVTK